ncbi:hypothetical protein [Streptomyces sp. NPDC059398]|uniref:hypothetical protein n=1 Tax=Streptomyces sp. NPDC059398 TaxID=3346820 RepID=UPI0036ABAABB
MHSTKIVALALLAAAVSAASGCVAVPPERAPAPGQSRTPGHHAQRTGPQIVQSPPVEALETVSPRPGAGSGAGSRDAAPAAHRPSGEAGPGSGTERDAGPAPVRRAVRPARPRAAQPGSGHPDRPLPRRHPERAGHPSGHPAGVCALGEGYGGWPADSPQARICRQTYGR